MTDQGLRITYRCLVDDLGVAPVASGEAQRHVGVHRVVRAFVQQRSQLAVGQETFRCATEVLGRTIYTLHAGTHRGATWHEFEDEEENEDGGPPLNVVWLLGARPNHDYDGLCDIAVDGDLLPAAADYQLLIDESALSLARAMTAEVPLLREQANRRPGVLVEGLIAGSIPVRLVRDADNSAPLLTVAICAYPLGTPPLLEPDWFIRLVAAFFPSIPMTSTGRHRSAAFAFRRANSRSVGSQTTRPRLQSCAAFDAPSLLPGRSRRAA